VSLAGRLPEDLLWRDVGWEINRVFYRLSGGRAGMLLLGQFEPRGHPPASSRTRAEGEEMSNRPGSLGARLLILGWLIVIVVGFFTSLVMSIMAFRNGTTTSGVTLGAIAVGCAVLCYRTYAARDDLLSNWK
jgi:hypothetical protein